MTMVLLAIPSEVIWSYSVAGLVFVLGLAVLLRRHDWQRAEGQEKGHGAAGLAGLTAGGLERLIPFGPLFYAAPLAAFGTEHFTQTAAIASIVPKWIPWHYFWAYFVGACFIAASFSLVTGIQRRLSASLLALTFFLFVALMDVPGWMHSPGNRIAVTLALRELSFGAGALALAAALTDRSRARGADVLATIARYFIAAAVLFYSFEQFMHGDHVPGVPLEPLTPGYVYGHAIWTYLAAAAYAVTGSLLLVGKKTRAAAAWLGLTVLLVVVVVYVPIAVVERASLNRGLNYVLDTLMYCGAVLLLAGAMHEQ